MSQREIKFRFWDKTNKKFDSDIGLYNDGELGDFSQCFHNRVGKNGVCYVAQQYTGISDINGKDIYEGDIVIWPPDTKDENIPNPYRNEEDAGQFLYYARKSRKQVMWTHYMKFALVDIPSDGSMTHSFNQYCQIIGNIFENPELLKP